jgi:hypothetical protein
MKLEFSYLYRPQYWRLRAEETRTLAEQMTIQECKEKMLRIAEDYEAMANCLERHLRDLLGVTPDGPPEYAWERKVTPLRPAG